MSKRQLIKILKRDATPSWLRVVSQVFGSVRKMVRTGTRRIK